MNFNCQMGQSGHRYCQHAAWLGSARGLENTRQRLGSPLCPWPEVQNQKWWRIALTRVFLQGGGDWRGETCTRSSLPQRARASRLRPDSRRPRRGSLSEGQARHTTPSTRRVGTRHTKYLYSVQFQESLLTFSFFFYPYSVPAEACRNPLGAGHAHVRLLGDRDSPRPLDSGPVGFFFRSGSVKMALGSQCARGYAEPGQPVHTLRSDSSIDILLPLSMLGVAAVACLLQVLCKLVVAQTCNYPPCSQSKPDRVPASPPSQR